jgi:aminomethyltransferase
VRPLAERLGGQGHFRQPHLRTPFHDRVAAAMRTSDWYAWAGYAAAHVVEDAELEYFALRSASGVFDVSPMTKYRITGPDAAAYLDRLTVRSARKLRPGRVHYTAWCDGEGHVLDDGTLFHLPDGTWRLCCQERHLPWLLDSAVGFDVAVEEVTSEIAALALQGPTSAWVLRQAGFAGVATMKPFDIREAELGGLKVTISRTGFTGDLGYELFVAAEGGPALWDLLMEAGRLRGIRPIGYAALDLARLEAGFIVASVDFITSEGALRADRARSPFEIGLGWMVDFERGHFNGRRALAAEHAAKSSRTALVGLEIEGNVPALHAIVYHGRKREAGIVTSAAWSPTGKRNIALATLDAPYGTDITDDLWVEIYALRELRYQKLMVRARIVDRPFVVLPRRTATPPGDF